MICWVLWLMFAHQAAISQPELQSYLKDRLGHDLLSSLFTGSTQTGRLRALVLCQLLVGGHSQFLSCQSLSRAAHNLTFGFHHGEKSREQDRAGKREAKIFLWPNLRSDSPSFLLYTKSESLSPAHSQRLGNTQGHGYQEARITGDHLSYASITVTEENYSQNCQDKVPGSGYTSFLFVCFLLFFFLGLRSCP